MTGLTHESHPNPSDGPAQEGDDLYLPCSLPLPWFALLCAALPGAAMVWLYFPSVHGAWAAIVLFAPAAPLLSLAVTEWVFRNQSITLRQDGITVGRRTARWREVTKVCWLWPRYSRVVIVLGQRPRATWRARLRLSTPRLGLVPRLEVFEKVLPALLRQCPGAAVNPRLARALADPAWATAQRRWPALVILAVGLTLLAMPWVARHAEMQTAAGLALLLMVLGTLVQVGGVRSHEPGARFSAAVAVSLWAPLLAATAILWADLPIYAFDTVMVLSGVLCLAAGAAFGLRWRMRALAKAAILTCAIGAAGAVWQDGVRHDLPRTDITPLLAEGRALMPLPFVWSPDGDLAVEFGAQGKDDERQHLVDLPLVKSRTLPGHKAFQMTVGVSRQCVVRVVSDPNRTAVYAYRLADGHEVCLSDRPGVNASLGLCLSPDGRKVCWLDKPAGDDSAAIHVYDVQTDRTETPPVAWPAEDKTRWTHCAWVDDAHLAVQGHQSPEPSEDDPCPPSDLHVLRVDLAGAVVESLSCPRRFRTWRVCPDFRHAFAEVAADGGRGISYVDLTAGRVTNLGEGDLPSWQGDGRYAWRVAQFDQGARWLCRFDPANATWTRWLPIAPGSEVLSLTPNGRQVLVRHNRRSWPMEVVDVPSGRRQRLGLSLFSTLFTSLAFPSSRDLAWVSLLSPDGRHLVVMTQWGLAPPPKVCLYTLGEDWTSADRAEVGR